ncbi:MAG: hypothetical protein ACI95C_001108 [Pseudohongiellaceae bacterium]|jgi:hypothetical protein
MDYWETRKPGVFAVIASWACGKAGESSAWDEVVVTVLSNK